MKIFLDLDGVLVNWSGGLCNLLGIDPLCEEAQKIMRADYMIQGWKFGSPKDVDDAVIAAGYDFWINLELTSWAHRLVELCKKYGEVYFLTSPGVFHAGAHAKLDYIRDNFDSKNYILTKHKYLCSKKDCILIDDMKKNIEEWDAEEGLSFHWPCQWKLKEDPKLLEHTFRVLEFKLSQQKQFIEV